jgi:hypothetical protein
MTRAFLLATLLLQAAYGHGQAGMVVEFPFDYETTIRGIKMTITVLEIEVTEDASFMKARFSIPVNGVMIRFQADEIPFNNSPTLDFAPFLLRPLGILSAEEEEYLLRLMKPYGAFYRWQCFCPCDTEPISF